MKTTIPLLFLLFLMASCKEKTQPLPEEYTTKKLDTVRYGGIPEFEKEYRFGDTIVRFSNLPTNYIENIGIGNTGYGYVYDKTTFLLKIEAKRFSSISMYFKEYDKHGKLIRQKNYLQGYTFTPEQLALKMKRDFDVNLTDAQRTDALLGKNFWGTPYYRVRVLADGNDYREIRINGKTGNFMGEVKGQYEE